MLAEAGWQSEHRNRYILHTERPSAHFAVEMYVVVLMMAFAMFVAQFVVHHSASVLKGMDNVVLEE